jgi:hypothetical protein
MPLAHSRMYMHLQPDVSLDCVCLTPEIFEGSGGPATAAALKGRKLLTAHRRGKYMWWDLSGEGPAPLMHFGEPLLA